MFINVILEISKDYLLSYTYKNNQVFLVSFPKTGRTWLSYMLDQIEDKS